MKMKWQSALLAIHGGIVSKYRKAANENSALRRTVRENVGAQIETA
jgi:hypothetical protein